MKPMFAVAELLPTGPGIRAGRLAWRSEVGRCSCAVRSLRTCRDGPEDRPSVPSMGVNSSFERK
jgi:hypothetical protein